MIIILFFKLNSFESLIATLLSLPSPSNGQLYLFPLYFSSLLFHLCPLSLLPYPNMP